MSLFSSAAFAAEEPVSFFDDFARLDKGAWYLSDGWRNGPHQSCIWSAPDVAALDGGLELTIRDRSRGDVPYVCAEVQSTGRLGFGTFEARLKVAAGSGLNTALFTYIGPSHGAAAQDEVDIEFLGKDTTKVQLNWFASGQGEHEVLVDLGFDASEDFHDYAFTWSADRIVWYVDGREIHRTPDGAAIPQTPGLFMLTLWSGSDQVADWLGPFHFASTRPKAIFEWVGYTAEGDTCLFPQSVTCRP